MEPRMVVSCQTFCIALNGTEETTTKGNMDPEGGARNSCITGGHCTYAELTSGHALASCYSC